MTTTADTVAEADAGAVGSDEPMEAAPVGGTEDTIFAGGTIVADETETEDVWLAGVAKIPMRSAPTNTTPAIAPMAEAITRMIRCVLGPSRSPYTRSLPPSGD